MRTSISYKIGLLLVIGVLAQSCFVAKNYDRPQLEEVEGLYRTDQLPLDSVSMATISWDSIFQDVQLQLYIRQGLENNLDIRIALQQMAAAEAYMKQGKAGYWPTLGLNATATHNEFAKNSQFGSVFDGSLQQYELSANLSWEADIWGKIRSQKRAGDASYLQSVAAHQAVKSMLISQIALAYYQLAALDAQMEVTQLTIANRKNSLETIKALKEAGNVNQVAVDQTAAQLYNAQALAVDIKTEVFRLENAFNLLLGKSGGEVFRTKLDNLHINTDLELGVPALLLSNRPDVMASEYALINAFEMTNVAKSAYYPSLTLSAQGGFQSVELDKWLDAGSIFATLVGGLAQPIFNQRQIKTQHEVAIAEQESALLRFKKSLLIAGEEVSNALFQYQTENEKYNYRFQEVEALRKAESNSEILLDNGFGTYLDLLTARENALQAELNLVANKLDQLGSVVELYRALGGGWQ